MPLVTHLAESPFVRGVLLCSWDHIFGPLVEHVWSTQPGDAKQDDALYKYVARQSLDGEIFLSDGGSASEDNGTKFAVFSEYGVVVKSMVFEASPDTTATTFGLTLMVPQACLSDFLALSAYLDDVIARLAKKVQTLLNAFSKQAFIAITELLEPVVRQLSVLVATPLSYVRAETALAWGGPVQPDLLVLAVTSLLQTMSHAVVVGTDLRAINDMIHTLSYFLILPEDRRFVRTLSAEANQFVPGFKLQGLLLSSQRPESAMRSLRSSLLQLPVPSTVVDLVRHEVYQGPAVQDYGVVRSQWFGAVLEDTLARATISIRSQDAADPPEMPDSSIRLSKMAPVLSEPADAAGDAVSPYASVAEQAEDRFWKQQAAEGKSFYRAVRAPASRVALVIKQVMDLPLPLRHVMLLQSMRLLVRRSAALLTMADAYARKQTKKVFVPADFAAARKKLKSDLDIDNDEDFVVLVALAEKFNPGVFVTVYGDPMQAQKKVMDLFQAI